MRDILVTVIVFLSLPMIFRRPALGTVMWVWISVMNPHSQGWGFARDFPFAAIIAGVTILAMVFSKNKYRLPPHPVTYVFLLFLAWMSVSAMFALHPDEVNEQWIKVYKIFGMTLVVMMLLNTRKDIEDMIWAIVVSLGYYGVKGGIFTIRSGGNFRVWGPEGTFIDGNNEIALALVVVIPLMYYLHGLLAKRWMRWAMLGSLLLCGLAALGSYSRGAALAIGAMTGLLWLKSHNKLPLGIVIVLFAPMMVFMMPKAWHERIDTIDNYEEDSSAMGRINAWHMTFNLANDRPLVGGGFSIYDAETFERYAPNPLDVHAAHSIYFQVLGEHGWVGLLLYLTLGLLTWRTGSWVVRFASPHKELEWAVRVVTMLQVSMVGFAVGGAFLSLAYFDVPYFVMAAMVATRFVVARELPLLAAARATADASPAGTDAGPGDDRAMVAS